MWRIERTFSFSAMHKLEDGRDSGNIHGHVFTCKISIEDNTLSSDGKLFEKADLDTIVASICRNLEGKCLLHNRNSRFVFLNHVPVFLPVNPTLEELVRILYMFVKRRLLEKSYPVTILESVQLSTEDGFCVEFFEDL